MPHLPRRSAPGTTASTAAALVCLLAAGLAGCSGAPSAAPVPAHSAGGSTGGSTGASPSGSPAGAPSPGSPVVLDEHATGRTVTVGVGRVVELDLHSTYWSAPRTSDERVLVPLGAPAGVPGTNCHPGSGCGVMRARYTAERAGTATLTAQRTSCGEAMACPPGSRTFTLSVHVVMGG